MATSVGKEYCPAGDATTNMTTGGNKPLHRFLRGEPKSVGIVMMFMGSCLFMFGIPLKMDSLTGTSADIYSSFWLGILYFTCGLLYVLAEREPTKKIITASLAFSILSILGSIVAAFDLIAALALMCDLSHDYTYTYVYENNVEVEAAGIRRYMQICSLEAVFLFNSLIGGTIVITMTVFARMALRSGRTQAVVVMRNLPATE